VAGDPAQHVGQPSLGINAVQLGGLDQGVSDGGRLAAARDISIININAFKIYRLNGCYVRIAIPS
jgi:hypothetical protein